MAKYVCKLCPRLIISESVTFTAPNLIIDLPAGSYGDHQRYCIVVAQAIPDATTITAPVFVTIGGGTELYPLNDCSGTQVLAAGLRTRTRYSVLVSTNATGGSFRLLGKTCCTPDNSLPAIDGTAPEETP